MAKVHVRLWCLSFRRSQDLGVFMVDSCERVREREKVKMILCTVAHIYLFSVVFLVQKLDTAYLNLNEELLLFFYFNKMEVQFGMSLLSESIF